MSWAITKSAINSDLSTPINEKLGRVQQDGGFDGAVFDDVVLADGVASIDGLGDTTTSAIIADPTDSGTSNRYGVTISPNTNLIGLRLTLYDAMGTLPAGAKISITRVSDSTLMGETIGLGGLNGSGLVVEIKANLVSGVAYTVNLEGDTTYTYHYVSTGTFASTDIDVVNGSSSPANTHPFRANFKSVGAVVDNATTGTITKTIEPSSLYKFENIFFNTVTPANTSISCRILDADDNQLIASISDKGSLASIDTTQYKSIKAEWTLQRNSVSDNSPELYTPFWTWTGEGAVNTNDWVYRTPTVSTIRTVGPDLTTVVEVTGKGVATVAISSSGSSTVNATAIITVDGVVISNVTGAIAQSNSGGAKRVFGRTDFLGTASPPIGNWGITGPEPFSFVSWIGFENSFKYEVRRETATNIDAGVVIMS